MLLTETRERKIHAFRTPFWGLRIFRHLPPGTGTKKVLQTATFLCLKCVTSGSVCAAFRLLSCDALFWRRKDSIWHDWIWKKWAYRTGCRICPCVCARFQLEDTDCLEAPHPGTKCSIESRSGIGHISDFPSRPAAGNYPDRNYSSIHGSASGFQIAAAPSSGGAV